MFKNWVCKIENETTLYCEKQDGEIKRLLTVVKDELRDVGGEPVNVWEKIVNEKTNVFNAGDSGLVLGDLSNGPK